MPRSTELDPVDNSAAAMGFFYNPLTDPRAINPSAGGEGGESPPAAGRRSGGGQTGAPDKSEIARLEPLPAVRSEARRLDRAHLRLRLSSALASDPRNLLLPRRRRSADETGPSPETVQAFAQAMARTSDGMQVLSRMEARTMRGGRDAIAAGQSQLDTILRRALGEADADLDASRVRLGDTAFALGVEIDALGAALRTTFDRQAAIARSRIAARAATYAESVNPVVERRSKLLADMARAQEDLFTAVEAAQQKMATIDSTDEVEANPSSIAIGTLSGPVRQADNTVATGELGSEMAAAVAEAIRTFVPARAVLIQESLADNFNLTNARLASAFSCIPCSIDRGLMGVSGYVQQVNTLGPASIAQLQAQAERTVQRMIEGLQQAVRVNAHAAERRMIEDHARQRDSILAEAEAGEDALAAQGETALQGVMDRIAMRRDALALAAEGVRDRLAGAGADPEVGEGGFAAMVTSAASGLMHQVGELLAEEDASADAALGAAGQLAQDAAVAARKGLSGQVAGIMTARRRLVDGMTRTMRDTFAEAGARVRPMGDGFGSVAEGCLPPMENGFNLAKANMLDAIGNAEISFYRAMHGQGGGNGGGGGGGGGREPTPRVTSSSPGDEPLTSSMSEPVSRAPEGEYGMSLPDGTSVVFTAEDLGPEVSGRETRRMPDPATCVNCHQEEAGETRGDTDTNAMTCEPEAPNLADLPEEQLNPDQFIRRARDIARQPMQHSLMKALVQSASTQVPTYIQSKASTVKSAFDAYGRTDVHMVLDAVQDLSAAGGRALIGEYHQLDSDPGTDIFADFDEMTRFSFGANEAYAAAWTTFSGIWDDSADDRLTNAANAASREFRASLSGHNAEAAVHRLRRLVFGINDTARIETVLDNLTQAQLAELNAVPAIVAELRAEMSDEQAARFSALLAGTNHERIAGEMHNRLADLRMAYTWDEEHGEKVRDTIRTHLRSAENGASVGAGGMARRDVFDLELAETTARRRTAASDAMVQAFADRRGVRAAANDMPGTDLENAPTDAHSTLFRYATADALVYRGVSRGITTRTRLAFDEGHRNTIAMMLAHGVDSNAAKGAELYTETVRSDDPPRLSVIQNLLPPPGGAAVEGGRYDPQARAAAARQAAEDRDEIFGHYEAIRARLQGGEPATGTEEIARAFGEVLAGRFEGNERAQAMARELAQPTANHALETIEYAIAEGNFDIARTLLQRMDRVEIDRLRADYAERHGGGTEALDRALGVGRHRFNLLDLIGPTVPRVSPDGSFAMANPLAAFTGDEANDIEMAMHGVPQNDFERGYLALRMMEQTTEQATTLGSILAGAEFLQLQSEAQRLRRMMGTGDLKLDHMGRIAATDPATGQPVIAGNFTREGTFLPAHGDDIGGFASALNLARTYAQNYKDATDRAANFIATAIVVTAAIVSTALTGGAAASLWIPVLVTLGGGILAMGATAAIKGSRYSRDQVLTDLATHIVSAATAGLASAATVGIRGAMAGGLTGGKAAMSALAGNMRISEEALAVVARGMLAVDDVPAFMALSGAVGSSTARVGLTTADKLASLAARGAGGADEAIGMVASAGGLADDAAALAARGTGLADDAAGLAARGTGLADDAAAAGAGLASASDDAVAIAARAAGVSDDAMREILLKQPPWFVNALIGGLSSAAGNATGAATSLQNRRREDYWEKVGLAALRGFIGGFVGGAVSEGMQRGVGTRLQNSFGTAGDIFGRGLGGGLSGSASKGAELLFEIGAEGRKHTSGSFAQEVLLAGLQGSLQSGGEAIADHARRRVLASDRAEHAWMEAGGVLGARTDDRPAPRPANDADASEGVTTRIPQATDDETGTRFLPDLTEDSALARSIRETMLGVLRDETPSGITVQFKDAAADTPGGPANRSPGSSLTRDPGEPHGRPVIVHGDLDPAFFDTWGPLPAGSEVFAADPHSADAARANYRHLFTQDPFREVALAFNPHSGIWKVVQGIGAQVHAGGLPWIVKAHTHDLLISGDPRLRLAHSLPSGTGADMSILKAEVDFLAGLPGAPNRVTHEAEVHAILSGRVSPDQVEPYRVETTRYSVTKEGDNYTFSVEFTDPHTGRRMVRTDTSTEQFDVWAFYQTEIAFGAVRGDVDAGTPHRSSRDPDDDLIELHPLDLLLSDDDRALALAFGRQYGHPLPLDRSTAAGQEAARAFIDRMATPEGDRMLIDLGLIGEPQSVTVLARVLNDETLPFATRLLIAERTRSLTEQRLHRENRLPAGERLHMFFHGSNKPIRDALKHRTDPRPGEDFDRGFYVSQDLAVAYLYDGRHVSVHDPSHPLHIPGQGEAGRSPRRDGEAGEVYPFFVPESALGTIIDVSSTGRHRRQWEDFINRVPRPWLAGFPPAGASIVEMLSSRELIFKDGVRGEVFQLFLERELGIPQPDIILGDVGGVLTGGISLSHISDQAAIRSSIVLDHFNAQHGFDLITPGRAMEWPPPGPMVSRSVDAADPVAAATRRAVEQLVVGRPGLRGRVLEVLAAAPGEARQRALADLEVALPAHVYAQPAREDFLAAVNRIVETAAGALPARPPASEPHAAEGGADRPPAGDAAPSFKDMSAEERAALGEQTRRAADRLREHDPLIGATAEQRKDPAFLAAARVSVGSYEQGKAREFLHAQMRAVADLIASGRKVGQIDGMLTGIFRDFGIAEEVAALLRLGPDASAEEVERAVQAIHRKLAILDEAGALPQPDRLAEQADFDADEAIRADVRMRIEQEGEGQDRFGDNDAIPVYSKIDGIGMPEAFENGIDPASGQAIADFLRSEHNLAAERNIAIAYYADGSGSQFFVSKSGKNDVPAGMSRKEGEALFEVHPDPAMPNDHHTEPVILEQLAADLHPDAEGRLVLYTERPACASCRHVFDQFHAMFPKIELIVTFRGGIDLEYR